MDTQVASVFWLLSNAATSMGVHIPVHTPAKHTHSYLVLGRALMWLLVTGNFRNHVLNPVFLSIVLSLY